MTLTSEEKLSRFIEKANKVHAFKYDYTNTIYFGQPHKLKIFCSIHGEFIQDAASHLRGRGCPKCGVERRQKLRATTTREFIEKAVLIHGDKYDYSESDCKGIWNPITIICPIHNRWVTKPVIHLGGSLCPKCAILQIDKSIYKRTDEEFINLSKEKHGNKFEYGKVNYCDNNTKLIITCKEHGDFHVTPRTHLGKSEFGGCPKCTPKNNAGFTKTGWVNHCKNKGVETSICYIIRLYNDLESFVKIGITTDFNNRITDFPYKCEIFHLIKDDPIKTYEKEKQLHKQFKQFKYSPNLSFNGKHECFTLNIYK